MVLKQITFLSAISFVLIFSACSFRNVVHPYPYKYTGNPEEAIDRMDIVRQNGYFYVHPDSVERISLQYLNGALNISTGLLKKTTWSKNDSYINPISKEKLFIGATAEYNPDYDADEFVLSISENRDDSLTGYVEGLIEDATVYLNQSAFRFTALEVWEPRIKKTKKDRTTVWNHYPLGGSWSVQINGRMIGEIVQGSPVVERFGTKMNYGESFTFLFIEKMDSSLKAELINAWMAYLALADIEYYYYECDYNYQYDKDCPGSVIVR